MLSKKYQTLKPFRSIVKLFSSMPPKKIVDNKQKNIASFFKSEKRNASSNDTTAKKAKTDIETLSALSPEQKKRMDENKQIALKKREDKSLVGFDIGSTWRSALQPEFTKPYFLTLCNFLENERKQKTVYPPEKDVFSWTRFTDICDTKVVILGQDPYHGPKQAHGLCFSVQTGVRPPPSLVNIYKELQNDIDGFTRPDHGYLVGWANQGVLLLNACLTVVSSQANSHKDKGWEKFTDATIKWLNSNLNDVVFILWGGYAQKKGNFLDKKRHLVLNGPHPSPLSAHRGFFGCKHFSKANDYLKLKGKKEIDWTYLPSSL